MPGWMNHKLESNLPGEINNLRYADDITLMAESREELKMRMKEKNENVGLKLNIQKNKFIGASLNHFMANRWRNSGSSDRFYFLGSKITAKGDYSHEIKRRFLLGRKVLTNLDIILKSREISLPTKSV